MVCVSSWTHQGCGQEIPRIASPHQSIMGSADKAQLNWHFETLPKPTKKALDFLSVQEWLRRSAWYLAGGTALALCEGHRTSLDLDFFYPQKNFNLERLLSHLDEKQWMVDFAEEGTIYASFQSAKVSFIAYPFFIPKQPLLWYGAVKILHSKDIAVMKIVAISQRGRKRDFVDLYWHIKNQEPLADILLRLPAQYPAVAHDYHHILKSLLYFEDAEKEPMPKLYFQATWKEIKKYFQREVPRITKEFLGLK